MFEWFVLGDVLELIARFGTVSNGYVLVNGGTRLYVFCAGL